MNASGDHLIKKQVLHLDSNIGVKILVALQTLLASGFWVRFWPEQFISGYTANRLLGVLVGVIILLRASKTLDAPRIAGIHTIFFVLLFSSTLWSNDWIASALTSFSIVTLWLCASSLNGLDLTEILKICRIAFSLALLISLITNTIAPEYTTSQIYRYGVGIEPLYIGLWNWNSEIAVVACLNIFIVIFLWSRTRTYMNLLLILLTFWTLVLADSALTTLSLGVGLIGYLYNWKPFNQWRLVSAGLAISFTLLFLSSLSGNPIEAITLTVGRDQSLSGRTVVWNEYYNAWFNSPFLGHGVGNNLDLTNLLGWTGHAHNGFLSIAYQLGLVGLLIIISIFIKSLVNVPEQRKPIQFSILLFIATMNLGNDYLMAATLPLFFLALFSNRAEEYSRSDLGAYSRPSSTERYSK